MRTPAPDASPSGPGVDLYWLPLGAGGHCVAFNGRVFEAIAARRAGREVCDLYHAALELRIDEARYVVEMAPAWGPGAGRGAVATGPVGVSWGERTVWLRYEIRAWREGVIPDLADAVDSPQRLTDTPEQARQLLGLAAQVPRHVWGRDVLKIGDMWNSNSVVAWLLVRSGIGVERVRLPPHGRAPGWATGVSSAGLCPDRPAPEPRTLEDPASAVHS